MDIVLAMKSEDAFLIFRNCNKFRDGSGYQVSLSMRSGGFRLETEFFFEEFSLHQFVAGLTEMDKTLTGKATLKPMWENDFVEFAMDKLGHVTITGEFTEYGSLEQKLSFGFETDQTCLAPLRDRLIRLSEQ